MIFQEVPNLWCSLANWNAKKVSCIGMKISPPWGSGATIRSASSMVFTELMRHTSGLNSCALEAEIGLPQCETGFGSARGHRAAFVAPCGVTPIGVNEVYSFIFSTSCQLRHVALR